MPKYFLTVYDESGKEIERHQGHSYSFIRIQANERKKLGYRICIEEWEDRTMSTLEDTRKPKAIEGTFTYADGLSHDD